MNHKHLNILQHSLGVNQFGQGDQFRNHFVTSEGCEDHALCSELVLNNLMAVQKNHPLSAGCDCFWVTEEGKRYVAENSPTPPTLTKAQQRYKRYLEFSDSFNSFIDFCRWDADTGRPWNTSI